MKTFPLHIRLPHLFPCLPQPFRCFSDKHYILN
jgi:hypothetical protein